MANIASIVQAIRSVVFGKDMRENIAVGIETISNQQDLYEQDLTDRQDTYEGGITARQTNVETRQTNLESIFDAEIQNLTLQDPSSAEIVQARTDSINNVTHATLKERLDGAATSLAEMEAQKADDIDSNRTTTDKTVTGAINELNALATEKANQTALDSTNNIVALKADIAYVDTKVATVASGAPDKTFTTLSDLNTAYPTGDSKNKLVASDGHIYNWNGTAWGDTGIQYQSAGIADGSITSVKTTDNSQFGLLTYNSKPINFDFNLNQINIYIDTVLVFKKSRYLITNGIAITLDISGLSSLNIYGMFYNKTSNTFKFVATSSISSEVTEDDILIATFSTSKKIVNTPNNYTVNSLTHMVDGSGISTKLTDVNSMGLLVSDNSYPNFDFALNKIIFYPNTILIYKKSRYIIATGINREVDISTGTNEQFGLFYNKTSDTFSTHNTSQISNGSITENDILIATFQKSKKLVFMAGGYTINGGNPFLITPNSTTFLEEITTESELNLFNKANVTSDGYYDYSTLAWVVNSNYCQSEFIDCEVGDIITESSMGTLGNYVVFKNSNGDIFAGINVLSNETNPRSFTVPIGANKFSLSMRTEYKDTLMIVKNTDFPSEYIGFGKVNITDERLKQNILLYIKEKLNIPITNLRFSVGSFIGDSITYGYSPYDGSRLSIRWVDLVGEQIGLITANNYGISGSTLGSPADNSRNPMSRRYESIASNSDLICVAGGTNDWNFNVPLGTINDTTDYTFYGALKIMMEGLLTSFPNATIVFFTPLHRLGDTANGVGVSLNDYRKAIIDFGAKYGIAVLDLYATSGLYPDNSVNYNTYVPDGRHPNEAGHIKLANRITGFLKTL